jgi:hypothetical protein
MATVPDFRGRVSVWQSAIWTWVAYSGSRELRDWAAAKTISMDHDHRKKEEEFNFEPKTEGTKSPEGGEGHKNGGFSAQFTQEAPVAAYSLAHEGGKGMANAAVQFPHFTQEAPAAAASIANGNGKGMANAASQFSLFGPKLN